MKNLEKFKSYILVHFFTVLVKIIFYKKKLSNMNLGKLMVFKCTTDKINILINWKGFFFFKKKNTYFHFIKF